ncbi:potassium channel family protein [Candidatus Margulisiibacteriota bacterium]
MHIIIVGCGRVGAQLGIMLSDLTHNIVVVDKNPKSFRRLGAMFNGITITGIGFDPEILKRAGIERADAVAAVTNGDNSNIMISQIAKKVFQIPKVITRIYDPERAEIFKSFGLETICTTVIAAQIFKNFILHQNDTLNLAVGKDIVNLFYHIDSNIEKKLT